MSGISKIAVGMSPYLFILMVLFAVPMAIWNFNHWYFVISIMGFLGFLYLMIDGMKN